MSLGDDALTPYACAVNLDVTWKILQSHFLSDPNQAKNTTAVKYSNTVDLHLESFQKHSRLLRLST